MATQGYTSAGLPFGGAEPIARHASWVSAEAAAEGRQAKTARYIRALVRCRELTDIQATHEAGLPLSSVCSIRNGLGPCVKAVGLEIVKWPDGRVTKRTKFAWAGAEAV